MITSTLFQNYLLIRHYMKQPPSPNNHLYVVHFFYPLIFTSIGPQNTGDHFFKVGTTYLFDEEYHSWCKKLSKDVISGILDTPKPLSDIVKQIYPSVHASLVEFILKKSGESPTREFCSQDVDLAMQFIEALRKEVLRLTSSDSTIGGYLFKAQNGEYDDFSPFEIKADGEFFADYNEALDAFFTKSEIKKEEKKVVDKKPTKLKKIKLDQDRREGKLIDEIKVLQTDIEILQENIDLVDKCLNLIRTLIATGASWKDIQDQIEIQKTLKHPIAQRIAKIDIPNQIVTFAGDPNDKSGPEIEYGLSCHQNLEKMYSKKKKLESKLERTKIGREFALKKVNKEKEKEQTQVKGPTHKITTLRKRFWFEKFYWFITSDGYLVLGGRDALQNEILVKKYLTKGDLYFHADIHGASSCILKNPGQVAEIPQTSIDQGGCFAVCHSNAWNQKFMVPSWWVYHHQVSKTPPTGEFVPQGSFVIRGKKNYIQPQKLEMGLTVVFHIGNVDEDEDNAAVEANIEEEQNDEPKDDFGGDESKLTESDEVDENVTSEESESGDKESEDDKSDESEEAVNDSRDSEDDDDEDEKKMHKPSVRINTESVTITEIECTVKRSTKQRKATGYPKALEVDLESIKEQLGALNLLAEPKDGHVNITEPGKLFHTEEASRKIRERIPTGVKKKEPMSKAARNKLAKMKKKYGSDDEETQELRRLLTGSTKLKVIKQAEEEPAVQPSAPRPRTQPSQDTLKTIDDKELERYMKQFNRLCKDPKEDDIILNAIPMCAPFSALREFKTRIKLVPGNTKKGAIASQALHQFAKSDEKRANYIKLITSDQLILTMIGNCKVPTSK
ncbi:hypothetical protein BEWA_012840 [Theileria equi strain WA]|uniref:NFACT RNA-binding domain-containing protein n=1 Tax=Theileria equi strain WA TaxID=1537102 RepID=L1LBT7_THEEQ|nr:hypothetical protein BEWA_012840 [Theileria equi strain WA]EKX72725.1 hypothetical protein BEWA_012840 [Theileria equi strain WA]|eukprot:XP_004832177.1 hypothetical protein BEWA_012840 [Theileria equi strain WA]